MTPDQFFWVRLIVFGLILVTVVIPMLRAFATGVPYVPTSLRSAKKMAELLKITPRDRVIDPGCGDARLLGACLDAGAASAVGYELFFIPYYLAKLMQRRHRGKLELRFADSRKQSFADFTVVVCFMMPEVLVRMKPQLLQLPLGARIASFAFPIRDWTPSHVEPRTPGQNDSPIYIYVRGESEPRT